MVLNARLAARNMPCVTFGAFATSAPRPTPGKTYILLHWEETRVRPFQSRSANGLPVATRPRPSVARATSSGLHSHLLVGFDRASTTGRGSLAAIAARTSALNRP